MVDVLYEPPFCNSGLFTPSFNCITSTKNRQDKPNNACGQTRRSLTRQRVKLKMGLTNCMSSFFQPKNVTHTRVYQKAYKFMIANVSRMKVEPKDCNHFLKFSSHEERMEHQHLHGKITRKLSKLPNKS